MFDNLRKVRKENNISIAEMAEILGFKAQSAYCKRELEHVPFSLSEAKQISDLFGRSIDDLFFDKKVS